MGQPQDFRVSLLIKKNIGGENGMGAVSEVIQRQNRKVVLLDSWISIETSTGHYSAPFEMKTMRNDGWKVLPVMGCHD